MKQDEIVDPKKYERYLATAVRLVKAKDQDDDEEDEPGPLHFALAVGSKANQHRLGLGKGEQGRAMAAHLLQWTKLKEFTFGTAFFAPDKKDTLALELEHPAPSGAKKKAQALLKEFKAPRFSKVVLFWEGKEVAEVGGDEDSDDEEHKGNGSDESFDDDDREPEQLVATDDDSDEEVEPEPEQTVDPEKLKEALEHLKPALMKAITAHPELRTQLMAPVTVFAEQMKLRQYDAAKVSLERAAHEIQTVLGAPSPKPVPQVDEHTPQQKQAFDTGFRQLAPLLRIANAINATTPEMLDLKARMLKAEEGMKAAAGRTDYEAALKFIQPIQVAAQRLIQMHNTAETGARNLGRQQTNKVALTQALANLNGAFDGVGQEVISDRHYDIEAKRLFPKGGAQVHRDERLSPGTQFRDFLDRLQQFEDGLTPEKADQVEQAADAYLLHLRGLNKFSRNTKDSKRKKAIADQIKVQLAQYRQMMTDKAQQTQQRTEQRANLDLKSDYDTAKGAIEQAGDPPWNPVLESQLQGHHATLMMLSARQQGGPNSDWQGAPDLNATGDSQSFWINSMGQGGQKEKKFFFKPLELEDRKYGMPRGGMAAREIVAKNVGDRLAQKTGIDFGMPSITPAILPSRVLRGSQDKEKLPDGPIYGSMQTFVRAPRGALGSPQNRMQQDQVNASVPKEETQKIALMDMILLNTDRNANNLMLGGPIDQPPTLVPIDQGLCLPTRKVLGARGASMFNAGNALLNLPGANEKLSDDLQAKLSLITPDDIAQSVGAGRNTMTGTGRQDSNTLLSDESVQLSQRALAFVKRAAPHLTVKEIFNALGNDTARIFDGPVDQMEAAFDQAIAAAPGRVKALEEINTPPMSPDTVAEELRKLGWGYGLFGAELNSVVEREAESWLKILKAGTVNPLLQSMIDDEVNDLGNPPDLIVNIQNMPRPEAYQAVLDRKDRDASVRPNLERALVALGNPPQLLDQIRTMSITDANRAATAALRAEAQRGLAQLGNPEDLAGQVAATTPLNGYKLVQEALGRTVASPDSKEVKDQAYLDAGGDAVYNQLAESIPDTLLLNEKTDAVKNMLAWPKYLQLGGDDTFFALGGNDTYSSVGERIAFIKNRGNHRNAFAMLEQEKGFDKRIEERVIKDLESVTTRVMAIRDIIARGPLRGKLTAIQELTDAEKYEQAMPLLKALAEDLDKAGA